MKSILTPLVLAFLLLAAGVIVWTLGRAQERIAQVETQVATMEYAAVADDDAELDQPLTAAARVPRFGDDLAQAAASGRATAAYWLARYDALALERDAGGALVERDPRLLLLAANAAYRASRLDGLDRDIALDRLDMIVRNYADVLKSSAVGDVEDGGRGTDVSDILADAAFNYEFATRMRSTLERTRPGSKPAPKVETPPATIHGHQGGPPKDSAVNEFRIVIPKRSDERDQNPEGGQGQQRIRKG